MTDTQILMSKIKIHHLQSYGEDPNTVNEELEVRLVKDVPPPEDASSVQEVHHITITPISGDHRKPAFIDYQEQIARNSQILDGNAFWCWDDSKYNNTLRGDFFAFYLTESKQRPSGKFVIHQVEEIKSSRHRLSSWSNNVGQGDRNVLELSAPLFELTIEEWKYMGGPMKNRKTYRSGGKKYMNFMTELKKRHMMIKIGFM